MKMDNWHLKHGQQRLLFRHTNTQQENVLFLATRRQVRSRCSQPNVRSF